jgi:hypothetical protein
MPGGLAGRLDYRGLVNDYYRTFGPASVLVLPYELLTDEASDFLHLIADHFGIKAVPRSVDGLILRHNVRSGSIRRTTTRVGNFLGTRHVTGHMTTQVRRPWRADWLDRERESRALATLLSMEDDDNRADLAMREILTPSRLRFWSGSLENYNYILNTIK